MHFADNEADSNETTTGAAAILIKYLENALWLGLNFKPTIYKTYSKYILSLFSAFCEFREFSRSQNLSSISV